MKRRHVLQLSLAGIVPAVANQDSRPVKLGIIADPQYADLETYKKRYYRNVLGKLEKAIAGLNKADLDAVVTLGDFIQEDIASFQPVLERYKALKHPHLKVLGNRDFFVGEENLDQVQKILGMETTYASQSIRGWRLVWLDGTEVSTYRPKYAKEAEAWMKKLKDEGLEHGKPANGAIGKTQFAWLEEQLAAATKAGERVLLLCHFPVLPEDSHNLWNDREVVALIDKYPCVASWFNGHHHDGNYAQRKHCHYVNFKGMVEKRKKSAYAMVTLHPDRVVIDGFETEPDRDLKSPKQ